MTVSDNSSCHHMLQPHQYLQVWWQWSTKRPLTSSRPPNFAHSTVTRSPLLIICFTSSQARHLIDCLLSSRIFHPCGYFIPGRTHHYSSPQASPLNSLLPVWIPHPRYDLHKLSVTSAGTASQSRPLVTGLLGLLSSCLVTVIT